MSEAEPQGVQQVEGMGYSEGDLEQQAEVVQQETQQEEHQVRPPRFV